MFFLCLPVYSLHITRSTRHATYYKQSKIGGGGGLLGQSCGKIVTAVCKIVNFPYEVT